MKEIKEEVLGIRLTKSEREQIRQLAQQEDRAESTVARRIILNYFATLQGNNVQRPVNAGAEMIGA